MLGLFIMLRFAMKQNTIKFAGIDYANTNDEGDILMVDINDFLSEKWDFNLPAWLRMQTA